MSKAPSYYSLANQVEVRRFQKNTKSDDKFFEYIFVDTGIIVGLWRKSALRRQDFQ